MPDALVGLGSNLEPRRRYLAMAVEELAKPPLVLKALSSLYETEPMDVTDQPAFLNMGAWISTDLEPAALMEQLKRIEAMAQKKVGIRRGPRTLDLDLWFYGERILDDPDLTLPHPRIAQRPFVLVPMREIAPAWRHPGNGMTAGEMLEALPQPSPRVDLLGAL